MPESDGEREIADSDRLQGTSRPCFLPGRWLSGPTTSFCFPEIVVGRPFSSRQGHSATMKSPALPHLSRLSFSPCPYGAGRSLLPPGCAAPGRPPCCTAASGQGRGGQGPACPRAHVLRGLSVPGCAEERDERGQRGLAARVPLPNSSRPSASPGPGVRPACPAELRPGRVELTRGPGLGGAGGARQSSPGAAGGVQKPPIL